MLDKKQDESKSIIFFESQIGLIIIGAIIGFVLSLAGTGIIKYYENRNNEKVNLLVRENAIEDMGTEIGIMLQNMKDNEVSSFQLLKTKIEWFENNYHKYFIIKDKEVRNVLIAFFAGVPEKNTFFYKKKVSPEKFNEIERQMTNALIILTYAKKNKYNFNFNKKTLDEIRSKFIR